MPKPCKSGLERFCESVPRAYRGTRVGLIANPASVDSQFVHALDRFAACPEFRLTAGFGPQHGARGDKQDNMIESEDFHDTRLGIPIHSLYGKQRKPTPEMLAGLDVLFCDLNDVGARPYTFLSTMILAMEACAEQGKRFVVLDRPNPIGGLEVEGNVLDSRFRSFIGLHPIPMRHGLTMGELAELINREFGVGADLEVIPMKNWTRDLWMEETTLPWLMPSPNMPTLETATVYPGMVLVEGTNLSEGRGTTRPFELIGAPFVEPHRFASYLNALGLPGVYFRPVWFRPTFDKWQNQLCGGVQVHVKDRSIFRPVRTGVAILKAALELWPRDLTWRLPPFEYECEKLPIDILAGTDELRRKLQEGAEIRMIEASWQPALEAFCELRARYLRYPASPETR